jgi:predicted amidophosphoribosyltransferase
MHCTCPSCGKAITYTAQDAGQVDACPHCSALLTFPALTQPVAATRQKINRGWGWWSLLKLLGVAIVVPSAIWFFVALSIVWIHRDTNLSGALLAAVPAAVAMAFGAVLFKVGKKSGTGFICSNCGNSVGSNARLCPGCGLPLS